MTTPTDLVTPYLSALGEGFRSSSAPDGTAVVSTPFRFFNGDSIELAVWEDERGLHLSDRGGLTQSLLLKGLEVIYDGPDRDRLLRLLDSQGVCLRGASVIGAASPPSLGTDVQRLLQTLVDAQVAVREAQSLTPATEPQAYTAVRQLLDEGGARYREDMRISGSLGRRYNVDFQLAFRTEEINRAIMVIANGNTLEMAERWNFRFRDIHRARPQLKRLFLVADDAPWSIDAQRTIREVAEAVFPPGEEEALKEYLRTGCPAA